MRDVTSQKYPVFLISDSTAITVETLGRGILSQFPEVATDVRVWRFVEDTPSLEPVLSAITQAQRDGVPAVVFCTLVDPALLQTLRNTGALVLDVFTPFTSTLAQHWGVPVKPSRGRSHGTSAMPQYERRMQAVHYALLCDDGVQAAQYDKADLILLGVSRSGKTPTALYLAMQYSLFVANYPFTEEDMVSDTLPAALQPYRIHLFGLMISPQRLHEIREARRPNSPYAALAQCEAELRRMEQWYRQEGIPYLDVTRRSIEEVAGQILLRTGRLNVRPA